MRVKGTDVQLFSMTGSSETFRVCKDQPQSKILTFWNHSKQLSTVNVTFAVHMTITKNTEGAASIFSA